jgi:hypothetical protein
MPASKPNRSKRGRRKTRNCPQCRLYSEQLLALACENERLEMERDALEQNASFWMKEWTRTYGLIAQYRKLWVQEGREVVL